MLCLAMFTGFQWVIQNLEPKHFQMMQQEAALQVLGLEIKEVRVVAREDIRRTERQHLHTSRSTRMQVWFASSPTHAEIVSASHDTKS